MAERILVTGAGGFIGQALVPRLCATVDNTVLALVRRPVPLEGFGENTAKQVISDLLKPETYRAALEGCDAVVHLAAATGRATPAEIQSVNVEGTRLLLRACREAGVHRFLYASSIAAGYADQRHYHYARSKTRAETLVKESGLDYAILRPTIVLGAKSPIWRTLVRIAGLPVIPLPEGRPVCVQPIHVDDVGRGIERLLARGRLEDEVLDLGGPRPMPFREFLQLIRSALRGKPGRIVSVPLAPIRPLLAAVEPVLRPLMPVTAGQLSVFANDSVATENWLIAELRAEMASTEQTITALVNAGGKGDGDKGLAPAPKRQTPPPPERSQGLLDEECRSLTTYLVGTLPTDYVRERYAMAAQAHGLARDEDFSRFDRVTLRLARRGHMFARSADAYCALFHSKGVLRRKLVLLAAVLEHVAPTSEAFDRADPANGARIVLSLAAYGLTFAVSLLLGAAVLAPTRVACRMAAHAERSNVDARQPQ